MKGKSMNLERTVILFMTMFAFVFNTDSQNLGSDSIKTESKNQKTMITSGNKKFSTVLNTEISSGFKWTTTPFRSETEYTVILSGKGDELLGIGNIHDTWGPFIASPGLELLFLIKAARVRDENKIEIFLNDSLIWSYDKSPPKGICGDNTNLKNGFLNSGPIAISKLVKPGQEYYITLKSINPSQYNPNSYSVCSFIVFDR